MLILAAALALHGPHGASLLQSPACPDAWRTTPIAADAPARLSKLGDLPRASMMLPVLRTVEGCPVSTVVRFDVEGGGQPAKAPASDPRP